jgi:hypothetical protein
MAIDFTFRPLLATYFIFEKEVKKSKKIKAIAFTFCPLFANYFIFEKSAKNSKKVRL